MSKEEDDGVDVPLKKIVQNEGKIDDIESKEGPNAKWRQIRYAVAAHLGAFIMATVWSWSSTALPSLRQSHESIGEITLTGEAWIASITFLAGAMGSLVAGAVAERTGLRMSLIIASVPLLLGWLFVTFAGNLIMILVGRFITGFCVAGVGVSGNLVAEYSKASRRGRLNFLFDMMFCVGVLYIYIIGTFLSWQWQAGLCAAICVVFFVLLLTVVKESPRVLVKRGNLKGARKALQYIRDNEDVEVELEKIQRAVEQENTETAERQNEGSNLSATVQNYMNMKTFKPIFICICLQFFLQVCGVVPIVCYAVDVFKAAGTSQVHENTSTIGLGAINLGATMLAYFFVDKYGRRKLMMLSEAFLTITLLSIGIFLYFQQSNDSLEHYSWFLLSCFVIFIFMYSFGVGPLPWVVMGEIIAPTAKGFSNGVIILAARVFGFFVMFFFKDMMIVLGQHGVYWFFAAVCLTGFIFTFFFLPETKGRTLEQIQSDLEKGWFQNRAKSAAVISPT